MINKVYKLWFLCCFSACPAPLQDCLSGEGGDCCHFVVGWGEGGTLSVFPLPAPAPKRTNNVPPH